MFGLDWEEKKKRKEWEVELCRLGERVESEKKKKMYNGFNWCYKEKVKLIVQYDKI